ncbi:MAG: hypothetical protein PHW69_04755 [Elusimicrobiaceae bacterium]|nr:hypothetical protein [Elusimicrobiaceae bacterium]
MLNRLLDDLRFPIGLLFLIFSVILTIVGIILPLKPGSGTNLNLFAGGVMGVFALFMLGSAFLAVRGAHAAETEDLTQQK